MPHANARGLWPHKNKNKNNKNKNKSNKNKNKNKNNKNKNEQNLNDSRTVLQLMSNLQSALGMAGQDLCHWHRRPKWPTRVRANQKKR